MAQNKLQRFADIRRFPNVFEYPGDMKGAWAGFFRNANPLTLELACGKGEYTVGLARMYPHRNFVGVDVKGNRLWVGARTALQEPLPNVAFLRTQIDQIDSYFAEGEVEEIWITFPDPQLRFSRMKKRLTHPRYLRKYQRFLRPGGRIHLKTDSPDLYRFTREVIDLFGLTCLSDLDDVYRSEAITEELKIKTYYESLDIAGSNRVHYLQFRIDQPLPEDKDALLKEIVREKIAEGRG